jgi:5-formyltetrahydrofolate cyclo-ligase
VDEAAAVPAEKQRLRTELLAARRTRTPEALESARAAVRGHVLDRVGSAGVVAAYVPLRTEPGSVELLAELTARDVQVLVPVTLPDHDLDWAPWSSAGPGDPLGSEAIGTADLVLVPALAVASDGTRLGRGGGSYDRALARCRPDATLAALLFDGELVERLPRQPWDVPVSAVVMPARWVRLDRNTGIRFDR